MDPEDYPDKTVDELLDAPEDARHGLTQEEYEEVQEEYEDMREGAVLYMQAAALGEMFAKGQITFRRYVEMVEWFEDLADEKGVDLP